MAAVLSYPIVITLERPVRVTPEQAVRDDYAALSHHFPHFSACGCCSARRVGSRRAFGSFEGFKTYWKIGWGALREGHAGRITPLVFVVADFKSEKSAGMTRLDADFTAEGLGRAAGVKPGRSTRSRCGSRCARAGFDVVP